MTNPFTSHVVEAMLSTKFPAPFRKKIINHIIGSVVSLATDAAGSHVIDACWEATTDLRFQRDKIASELDDQGDGVRSDFFGKRVWRNWKMDMYRTRQMEWRRPPGSQEASYAKMPIVKKRPWQQAPTAEEIEPRKSKGKSYKGRPGIVTKHFSAVAE
jgi:nucleolar protein 9